MFFIQPGITRITLPVLDRIMNHGFSDNIVLEGRSLQLMYDIQRELSIFEPVDDDETRLIWLEIPRGTIRELKEAFGEEDETTEEGERQQEFLEYFPHETGWIFLTTGTYRDFTSLRISDRDRKCSILCNESHSSRSTKSDMEWFLQPLLDLVRVRVREIAKDPEAYHRYLDGHLPHRQRSGRIRSNNLNRILGSHLEAGDREYCIRVMRDLIRRQEIYRSPDGDWAGHNVPAPFEEMTIRTFCHYYRIADTLFRKESGSGRSCRKDQDDVKYYSNHGLHDRPDDYDLDSQADFAKFANDHYGELGLMRMDVGATDRYAKGKWLITFSFSYSACLTDGLKIAMALYETGAPFIFHEAENVLHALEETGWVRLSPFFFHDYIKGSDDEGVYALPYPDECGRHDEISRHQYDEIVRLAQWEPVDRIRLDSTVPTGSPLYDAIRDEVSGPLTVSAIRHLVEKKYGCYLPVAKDNETRQYYTLPIHFGKEHIRPDEKRHYPTFNEAMAAQILLVRNSLPH